MSYAERMEYTGWECATNVISQIPLIIDEAGVKSEYGKRELHKILVYEFHENIPNILIPNTDWDTLLKQGGWYKVRKEYEKMIDDERRWTKDMVNEVWYVTPPSASYEEVPKTIKEEKVKEFVDRLTSIFDEPRKKFIASLGDQAYRDWRASHLAVDKAFLIFDRCMKRKIPKLSF
ncbi:MAG: hypothetical protein QXI43_00160 [Candidatus Nitrosocaldus sp.]